MATEAQLKALQKAALSADLMTVRHLVEKKGVSPNARPLGCPESPLHIAERCGHWEIVSYLLNLQKDGEFVLKTTLDSSQASMLQVASALFGKNPEFKPSDGLCYGEASVMVNALLLQDEDEKAEGSVNDFYERIRLIDALVLSAKRRAFREAMAIYPPSGGALSWVRTEPVMKKYKELTEQYIRTTLATASPECIDIRAFFETIELHQQFGKYSGKLYLAEENPDKDKRGQNYRVSGRLFSSARLEKVGGMFELTSLPIYCSREDLIGLLGAIKQIAVKDGPLCLTLTAASGKLGFRHIVTIGYDAAREQWIFNDINRLFPQGDEVREKGEPWYVSDISELASRVGYSLIFDHDECKDFIKGKKAHEFDVQIYTRRQAPAMRDVWEEMQQVEWECRGKSPADEGYEAAERRMRELYSAFKAMPKMNMRILGMQDAIHAFTVPFTRICWERTEKNRLRRDLLGGAAMLFLAALTVIAAFYFTGIFVPVLAGAAAGLGLGSVLSMIYVMVRYQKQCQKNNDRAEKLLVSRLRNNQSPRCQEKISSSAKTMRRLQIACVDFREYESAVKTVPVEDNLICPALRANTTHSAHLTLCAM